MIASGAFSVKTKKHWRKLTLNELRSVLRLAFGEWKTLPVGILTDHELLHAGSPTDSYPSLLTLWLRGLGIKHSFIRPGKPTDQGAVERSHRTLSDFVYCEDGADDLESLQQALNKERQIYNYDFPSRAGNCNGRPPVVAYPQLLSPTRPYQANQELAVFDMRRVHEYLATFSFVRKVNTSGQVSLGRQMYSIGRRHAGMTVEVRFLDQIQQWLLK